MRHAIEPFEIPLLLVCLAWLLLASLAPPLAQAAHYHYFADQRSWLGIPHAMDVLSNLLFIVFGLTGLISLWRVSAGALSRAQYWTVGLFFSGLLLTAAGSAIYHWHPDDGGLALDRLSMVLAFAGLLGLAVVDRVSGRAGVLMASLVLLLGPTAVWLWAVMGNVLPWAVLQFGGLALLLGLALLPPLDDALEIRWGAVILIYIVAKVLEQTDAAVFALSGQLLSGHSLKHGLVACSAWPLIAAILKLGQNPAAGATSGQVHSDYPSTNNNL